LTTTAAIGRVDVHDPPVAVPFVIVTTPSLPAGFSNTYRPPWNSNFATSSVPVGHATGEVATVVCTRP
jgi:hypothetical protein